ncbi:MAG: HAD family hydrolase [Clostridium paraputrificum]
MVKNIIFDLGNVVLKYDNLAYLKSKIEDKDKIDKLRNIIFGGHEWIMLDEGRIAEETAIEQICRNNPELEEDIRNVFDNWYSLLEPIESTVEIIGELKEKGYKLFFLSNFHDKAFQVVSEEYSFFRSFDGGVVSYREKIIKPNLEIYRKLLDVYNLKPEECIFIDDVNENIIAGEQVGIKGIHLRDVSILREELEKYLVE